MKIAILGIRGIPANYGGFETFAEELAPRLVKKGHDVTVYGRSNNIKTEDEYYKGVKLIVKPTISHKYFDTVFHTFMSAIHCSFKSYDIILICNAANSIFAFIPRLFGKKVVVNVDGLERKRQKWNMFGKAWYFLGERFSIYFPNSVVTDARVIQDYYKQRYGKSFVMIPYGAQVEDITSNDTLKSFNLTKDEYVLYVSRLEPENNAHLVIKAFENVKTAKKLIIVGDAPYSENYIRELKETKDDRIIFTGYVFGVGYKELQSNAYLYVHATEVGGTHPALVEGMGFGNAVIANDTPENSEVVGKAASLYKKNDINHLTQIIQEMIDNPESVKDLRLKAKEHIQKNYSWETVTNEYEQLFKELL